jgi:hypothetical protein
MKKKPNPMQVKAVRVPADLWRDVIRAAKISGVSVSVLIRSALAAISKREA